MAGRKRGRGTMASFGLDPVNAAKKRIAMAKEYGLDVDPRDEEIVAEAEAAK